MEHVERAKLRHYKPPLPIHGAQGATSSDTGALNEARVTADLYSNGFSVYRNMAQRGPDLIATKLPLTWTIEVKTGNRYGQAGKLHGHVTKHHGAELLALSDDRGIRYIDTATRKTITLDELTAL
jgi:Holliday junction resolvase